MNINAELATELAIVIASWVAACASSILAIVLLVARPASRSWFPLGLAVAAMAIGYVGYGRWSPFRFFPQIGYTRIFDDGSEISLASSWFFVGPLVLGGVALLLAAWRRRRSAHVS